MWHSKPKGLVDITNTCSVQGYLNASVCADSAMCVCLMQDMAGNWERPRSANILTGITGTVLWAPLSVLEGAQHSLSSMLEGLFISALSISCNGKLQLRHAMKPDQLSHCAVLRRGHLTAPKLFELKHIASHLQPLISSLHDLFYPLDNSPNPRFRAYDTTVTIDSVQGICRQVCGDLSP